MIVVEEHDWEVIYVCLGMEEGIGKSISGWYVDYLLYWLMVVENISVSGMQIMYLFLSIHCHVKTTIAIVSVICYIEMVPLLCYIGNLLYRDGALTICYTGESFGLDWSLQVFL